MNHSIINEKSLSLFHTRYEVSPNGCWLWRAANNGYYGAFKVSRARMMAHIFSHLAFIGDYDESYIVDHLCMNKSCVNPDHLEAIPKSENVSRKRESLKKQMILEDGKVTSRMRGIRLHQENQQAKKENKMVSFSKRLKDGMERARIVMLWGKRIDATGRSRADFCRKHAIDDGQLSHWINGTHGPDWTSIDRVEKALAQEGV